MKKIEKTWAAILVIALPVLALCLSLNMVMRMPDVYQYVFKSTEQLDELNLFVDSDGFGDKLSSQMSFGNPNWKIVADDEGEYKIDFFSEKDMQILMALRKSLDTSAIFGTFALILLAFASFSLKDIDEGTFMRRAVKRSCFVYAGAFATQIIIFAVNIAMGFSSWDAWLASLEGSKNFYEVYTVLIMKYLYVSWLIVGMIIMILMVYGLFKLTKPRRIFSRGNY